MTQGELAETERTLGRVVVGYRLVASVWLAILAVITVIGSNRPERPGVVWATVILVAAWSVFSAFLFQRHPAVLRTWVWLIADVAMTIFVLESGHLAGSPASFYGGYPMSSVFFGVFGLAMVGGVAVAVALSVATALRLLPGDLPTNDSAAILIYLFGGVLSGWAMGTIRRSDRMRHEAVSALAEERASRARAEERAEVAAHLHDSVLQTLAMIQRSEDQEQGRALARRQERELRAWLFGQPTAADGNLADFIRHVAGEVEDLHQVKIDTVVVGDRQATERGVASAQAAREALVNAARHSGESRIALYAEITGDRVAIFVRDRGEGFDPENVPEGRKGISESIVSRMERHGGSVQINSRKGEGTEVVLVVEG